MKLDGFRGVLLVGRQVELWSRRGANLSGSYPELIEAAAQQLGHGPNCGRPGSKAWL